MNTDHVVLNSASGAFECRHCGASYQPAMPCPLTMWIGMSRQFIREHRRCLAPAVAAVFNDLPSLFHPQAD